MENGALKELLEKYGKDMINLNNGARTIVSVLPGFEHILIRNGSGITGIIAVHAVDSDLAERLREENCILKYDHSIAYVPTENGVIMCIKGIKRKRKEYIDNGDPGKPIEDELKTGYSYDKIEL
ncbi:MAG: hypothetical protein Q7J54_02760 [Candidatus Woesearchaeota archaeon]|nr:hypothetical protein [Candidatus Woesearchaeota archaeon]